MTSKLGRQAKIPDSVRAGAERGLKKRFAADHAGRRRAPHLEAVGDALTQRGVEPVETPNIHDLKLEEGQPLTFKATFDVVPTFDPGDLSTITAARPPATVEDAAVDQSLERLRERAARFEAVESGVVEAGHTVVLELERQGTDKDGKQGDVDKHDQVSIELGHQSNPPGFDAELTGMTPGQTKSFTLTYPTTTPSLNWRAARSITRSRSRRSRNASSPHWTMSSRRTSANSIR